MAASHRLSKEHQKIDSHKNNLISSFEFHDQAIRLESRLQEDSFPSGDDMIDEDIGGGIGDIVYPKIGTF